MPSHLLVLLSLLGGFDMKQNSCRREKLFLLPSSRWGWIGVGDGGGGIEGSLVASAAAEALLINTPGP